MSDADESGFLKCSQLLLYCVFSLHNDPFRYVNSYPVWVFSCFVGIAALGIFVLSNTWQLFVHVTKWLNLKHCLPSALVKGLHQSLFFHTYVFGGIYWLRKKTQRNNTLLCLYVSFDAPSKYLYKKFAHPPQMNERIIHLSSALFISDNTWRWWYVSFILTLYPLKTTESQSFNS